MSTQHFLSDNSAKPPIVPTERWLTAFPGGQWGDTSTVQRLVKPDDLVWVHTGLGNWQDQLSLVLHIAPKARVVVLSNAPDDREGLQAVDKGARGYCHAYATPEMLREVAQVVQQGGLWVGPELVDRIVSAARDLLSRTSKPEITRAVDLSSLSGREIEVANAVVTGKSNKEVADQLFISERTVKAHLGSVFDKLGVRDRLQLALRLSGRGEMARTGQP